MAFLLFLSLFSITTPIQENLHHNSPIAQRLEERVKNLCSKLITQRTKREQELEKQFELIKEEPLFQELLSEWQRSFKTETEKTHSHLKNTEQLLEAIIQENTRLLQSSLLETITTKIMLLEQEKELSFLIPGLKKERVILADIKEEFDFIKTINAITQTNLNQLKTINQLCERPEQKSLYEAELRALQKKYLALKSVKKAITLIEEIAYIEAEIVAAKQKDKLYVQLINSPKAAEFRKKEFEESEAIYQKNILLKETFFLLPLFE